MFDPVNLSLLAANGWAHRVGAPEHFAELIAKSQRTAVALEGNQVVGFARGITDGLSNGYLSMVVVSPERRQQGIGHVLVLHIMGGSLSVTWVLRAGREGASEFFAKLGFKPSSVAMERERRHSGT
jgi:ribosomal protein S18 acetylase RimI-like enzyme